jgi:hypothetical protein
MCRPLPRKWNGAAMLPKGKAAVTADIPDTATDPP